MSREANVEERAGSQAERGDIVVWLLPIVATLLLLGGVTWLTGLGREQGRVALERETWAVAEQVHRNLRGWVDARLAVAEHFAHDWPVHYRGRPEAYRHDVQLFLSRLPGVQALNWVDRDSIIRITVPNEGNEPALGAVLRDHPDPRVRTAIEQAVATGSPRRTSADVAFLQGGRGFAFYWPVRDEHGEFDGLLNGVVRIDEIMTRAIVGEAFADRFRVQLKDAGQEVARFGASEGQGSDGEWPFSLMREIDVLGGVWALTIGPTPERLHSMGGSAARFGRIAGYALSSLIGWLLYVSLSRQQRLQRGQRELSRLATAMEQASEGITVTDLRGRILYANDAFAELMGRTHAELVGGGIPGLAAANGSDDALLAEIRASVTAGKAWQGRYQTEWDDGSRHVRVASVTPVREGPNEIVSLVCVIRDVTREDALEGQLRQGQKMEAVGRLAGGAAHDFNNLLTVIRGCSAEILANPQAGADVRESAGMVAGAADRATALIAQLLAFSRRQTLRPERVTIEEVIDGLLPMLGRLLGADVELDFAAAPDPETVEVDRGQLEQVIVNLCLNAGDAMPEGGRLALATETVVADAGAATRPELAEGRYVALHVKDVGHGMPVSVQERMFDPFFTTKEVGSGTGLGLSTVYGIVEQSGGGLRVVSSAGSGTTISVFLPVAPATESPRVEAGERVADPDRARPDRESRLVLVAEDEPAILSLVVRALEAAGYRVLAAPDGEQALARVREASARPDVLLTDVVMPRLGGVELARRLSAELPGLRRIFMSGYAVDLHSGKAAIDPEDPIVQKPFQPDELVAAVDEVVADLEATDDRSRR